MDKAIEKSRFWSSLANNHLNGRQRTALQKLLDAGDEGFLGGLTAQTYCQITGAFQATVTRDLADLVEKSLGVAWRPQGHQVSAQCALWKRVAPQ